jgi:DNA-binding NarL/FixJ family response regulator
MHSQVVWEPRGGKLSVGDVAEWLTQRPAKPFIRVRFSASPPASKVRHSGRPAEVVHRNVVIECTVDRVDVLICSRSQAKGQFAADLLSEFPNITIAGRVHGDEAIRSALTSIPFDVCILGPTSVEKKYDLDPLASGVNYPLRKYVMLNTHVTTERVILAHQLGMNDVIDIGLHLATIDERLEKVLRGDVNLASISSITEIVGWLRSGNIAHLAQDEMDIRILIELIEGRTNEEIAGTVNLALQTVRNRISRLMKAAEVSNRTQLATLLLR